MTSHSDPGDVQIETGKVIGIVRRADSTLLCVQSMEIQRHPIKIMDYVMIRVIEKRVIDGEPVCIQLNDWIKWTDDDVWFTPRPIPRGISNMNRGLLWDIRMPLVQPAH